MSTTAAERLRALRLLVEQAKPVPMSASCLVNRGQVVALVDEALAGLDAELAESRALLADAERTRQEARADAERLLSDARAEAQRLTGETETLDGARRASEALTEETRAETEALKREADAYVDARMAALEAGLAKTLSQLRTMRTRLSERSGLDDDGG